MEITIIVAGKQIKAYVSDNEIAEAIKENFESKKTGYERGKKGTIFYHVFSDGSIANSYERDLISDRNLYDIANYYTNKTVAENNARADSLVRKLRRYAALHGGCAQPKTDGYELYFDKSCNSFEIMYTNGPCKFMVGPIFKSSKAAKEAIEIYRDDLVWYFTEYNPMPEE